MAIRIGIVGMGGIGNTHARCYTNNPNAEVVAVCDLVKEKADEAAAKYNARAFYNIKDMLASDIGLDVVDVTTSGFENGSWHYEPAMQAMQAGFNVFVEKPISNDVREAREMVEYAYKHDIYLACNLNHYFTEPADRAKQLIADGKIGQPVYLLQKMGFNGSEMTYGGPGSPRWHRPYAHVKAFLAHPFSIMRYFGGEITHIQAFLDRPGVRKSADDLMLSVASINMRFENGSVGYIISQRGDANFGLGGWWCFEMAGTKGTFCIENCVEKLSYWPGGTAASQGSGEPEVFNTGITDFSTTFQNRLDAFIEDLTNKVPKEHLRSSGRDALATLEYTFAVIKSYEEGGATVRPEPLPNFHGSVGYIW